jgi:hypothetical protein
MAENTIDITSANSESIMTIEELFPNGFLLQQFSTDGAISAESIQVAETRMGVDGKLVGGWIPAIIPVVITFEASSPTVKHLNTLYDQMTLNKRMYVCALTSAVPSIGTVFKFLNGLLQTATPIPAQKKVLDPTSWTFHFERFERSAL